MCKEMQEEAATAIGEEDAHSIIMRRVHVLHKKSRITTDIVVKWEHYRFTVMHESEAGICFFFQISWAKNLPAK